MGYCKVKKPKPVLNMVVAHPDYAYTLAPNLREADKKEIDAYYSDVDHGHVLQYGIETSDQCFGICYGDTLHGLWGHGNWSAGGPCCGGLGYIWMMTDDKLFDYHSLALTRYARKVIFPQLDDLYSTYGNWVHSENHVHIRWLLGAGFVRSAVTKVNDNPFSLYLRSNLDV
jgi:hypothetical protein